MLPRLRKVPVFGDGTLDLIWLQYQLDELYEMRAVFAHGSIFVTHKSNDLVTWRFDKYTRIDGNWTVTSTNVDSGFLAHVCKTADVLRSYLWNLREAVTDHFDWEAAYKTDCEIRANHRSFKEMIDFGIYPPCDLTEAMLSHYQEDAS